MKFEKAISCLKSVLESAKYVYVNKTRSVTYDLLLIVLIKQNCLLFDGWGMLLCTFPSKTNLRLHNISVTAKLEGHNQP